MPDLAQPSFGALGVYVLEGALIGVIAVAITKVVYWIEDGFDHLPIHWMWWPALGAVVVGIVGVFSPHTLGVGYDNIEHILSGNITGQALLFFCLMKFVSWSIALGSGTSGGTLAPLFTIGGGLGAVLGAIAAAALPQAGVDPRIAALVGMAATFAGASRALLASVVFAFEATRQPMGLVPLLGGCTASFMVSALIMKQTIMTEKIARRGRNVPVEYLADALAQVRVADFATREVVTLSAKESLEQVRARMAARKPRYAHQGYPVVDDAGQVIGLVTRRDLLDGETADKRLVGAVIKRPPVMIDPAATLRQAADLMVEARVGRLPVVSAGKLVGILTRRDLLSVHLNTIRESRHVERSFSVSWGRS
jgi:CIC family chloride channel protein